MKHSKALVLLMAAFLIFSTVGVLWAQQVTTKATITKSDDGMITFKTEKGDEVTSKISSKRTSIKIGDKAGKAEDIKAGDKIEITYVTDGQKNEPSVIKVMK